MGRRLLLLCICVSLGGVPAACGSGAESPGDPDASVGSDASGVGDATPPEPDAAPDLACDPYLPRDPAPELFIGPDGVLAPVLDLIGAADETIDILMYQFTIGSVVDALVAAHGRGVVVRVMLDPDQTANASARSELTAAGIAVQDAPAQFEHAHSKVLIADRSAAIVMSANLNGFSISSERNYGVVLVDRDDVNDLVAVFEADWSGAPLDLICTRLLVSPVNARERIIAHIGGAETTLDLAVMYISDSAVRSAVIARHEEGVAVRVLLADPAWIDSNVATAAELGAAGIPVKFLMTDQLHAKLIVADGVAFVGSENFSYTSLTQNREVGVLVGEPGPAAAIAAQFEADWAAGVVPEPMRHPYADFVEDVARPARYLGGEYLSVHKDPSAVDARVCLAFPDAYEIGMSHLGTKILYSLLNKQERIACERAFAPWTDMEAELRKRGLPILSLESASPLTEFDVIGLSLQYELTYTNVLTILDLAGLPLRAAARREGDPLILGGGPTAAHPEPMAPFFDAFFIGEAEELLPPLILEWASMRRARRPRLDALAELASRYPLYVPALYDVAPDPESRLLCVGEPRDPRAPRRVTRALVADLDKFPFPSDTPVPYAEAVFDRAAVEIARGCTEGCRFCQAGMMYRPVRERDPESIVQSIIGNVENGGYDETSLTCLSTADYSCITPLVKTVMAKLRERKVALAVSSLRAYGLNEELLDELASVRATGLTFAPEAGTQRMRDVVNKNVTEKHIHDSSERVFSRGWSRLKLYFMIGLPTEVDEDVRGIVETGARMLEIGRKKIGGVAEVTVSVSSHVPKPHTPFQWCAMDPLDEIARKQGLLRETARATRPAVKLKYHERGISHVEGIMARGDRRLADVIEHAWRNGARFDGWDEMFDLARWQAALAACGVEPALFLSTIPVSARVPWDHIDIGLEDGFLLKEYRKALKDRLSPPCGKPFGSLLHHTNVEEALADKRKLVCFDCGVACDLTMMREERIVYLRKLGAVDKPEPRAAAAPEPPEKPRKNGTRPQPSPQFTQGEGTRYRLRYTKLGRAAFISHLDVMRLLQRIFRRAKVELTYSLGFHPKPNMTFGPALGLGISSLGEIFDVRIDHALGDGSGAPDADDLQARLNEVSPEGIHFSGARRLDGGALGLSKLVAAADFVFAPATSPGAANLWDEGALTRLAGEFLARGEAPVDRAGSVFDARQYLVGFDVLGGDAAARLCAALDWPARPLLTARVRAGGQGSVKPIELARLLGLADAAIARLALVGLDAAGAPFDPLDPPASFAPPVRPPVEPPADEPPAGEP